MEETIYPALRRTPFAELCAEVRLNIADGQEHRLEHLWVKDKNEERSGYDALRWSCWRDGRLLPRPPHLKETDLLALLGKGVDEGLLSPFFVKQLFMIAQRGLMAAAAQGKLLD